HPSHSLKRREGTGGGLRVTPVTGAEAGPLDIEVTDAAWADRLQVLVQYQQLGAGGGYADGGLGMPFRESGGGVMAGDTRLGGAVQAGEGGMGQPAHPVIQGL